MNLATAGVLGALPAAWAWRHQRSRAVQTWRESALPVVSTDPLFARGAGTGSDAYILLHGLISTGQVFGCAYDQLAKDGQVIVPDLAGFGHSLQEGRSSFSLDDHLDALDTLAQQQGLFDKRWTIGAHSMGSSLALHWALRHPERINKIVCWGAPIYQSPEQAKNNISGGLMARLFALDTPFAEKACEINCRHRYAAGLFAAAFEPRLPTTITRAASLHTWPAYRDAMQHLVIEPPWPQLLNQIAEHHIATNLVWGDNDPVGSQDFAREISSSHQETVITIHPGADHHLPVTHPEQCLHDLKFKGTAPLCPET